MERRCYGLDMARSLLLGTLLVATLATSSLSGCRGPREPLYASPVVVGDSVLVRVHDAHARGKRVVVKAWMENRTDERVTLDPDALTLRLREGEVLHRAGRARHGQQIVLDPGEGRMVHLDYRGRRGRLDVSEASLVLDGVRLGDDAPRSLGEVALSTDHRAPPPGAPATAPARADAPEPPAPEEVGDEPADAAEEAPPGEEVEEPAEAWQVGSGG